MCCWARCPCSNLVIVLLKRGWEAIWNVKKGGTQFLAGRGNSVFSSTAIPSSTFHNLPRFAAMRHGCQMPVLVKLVVQVAANLARGS